MRIQVGDVRLYFDVEGAGLVPDGPELRARPTVILLHGGPGFDHSGFKPAHGALADFAQVIYLDHRGMGRSDRGRPEDWRLARWADDLRVFCDALAIERPVVLGHSFGGFVALTYASRHPDGLSKLVLSSTSARWDLERVVRAFRRVGGDRAATAARAFYEAPGDANAVEYARRCLPLYQVGTPDPDAAARMRMHLELLYHWEEVEGAAMDLRPALAGVACPTLVLVGEEDPITPVESSEEMVAGLPPERVRFERFAKASHRLASDRADDYFRTLREFVLA